jgi:hypothetical protein
MHMHLEMFQILDRDGFTTGAGGIVVPNGTPQSPPAEERGWKDTAMVAPSQILRVIVHFSDYKGKYPYHCHILEHEEHEMMRQFQTIACGDGVLDPTEACDAGASNGMAGSCCSSACTLVANGTACDDGNLCTLGDACQAGVCTPATLVPPPAEVGNVRFSDATTLSWDPLGAAPVPALYDVARGLVNETPPGSGASETCLASGIGAPPIADAGLPPLGKAYWYLARGRSACGAGTYGYGAVNGVPTAQRVIVSCP